jgi:hypothetical protein
MRRAPLPAMTRFEFRESVWLNAAHAVVYPVFALPAGLGFHAKGKVLFGRKKLPQRHPQRSRAWLGRTNWLERKNFSVQSSKTFTSNIMLTDRRIDRVALRRFVAGKISAPESETKVQPD